MVLDVKRAFLHGVATRTIYVELPEEESEGGKYTSVGSTRFCTAPGMPQ